MKNQKKLKTKQRHNKSLGIYIPNQAASGGGNESWGSGLTNKLTILESFKVRIRSEEYLKRHPGGK